MRDIILKGADGYPLYCHVWDDVKEPKGVIQFVHGMAEHGGRYGEFAEFMNKQGYVVFADDHRAHGKTEPDETRGHHKGDIFALTIGDLVMFHDYLKATYNLPQVLVGHSYGSFLAQCFLEQGTDVKGVALLGSANMGICLTTFGKLLFTPVRIIACGWRPKFTNKLSDLAFDWKYKGDKGPSQWVTSDLEKRKQFLDDPLCGIPTSINFLYCMMNGLSKVYKKENLSKLNKATPVGIFSGAEDPIGGWTRKVKKLNELYKKYGVSTELHLYKDARHELINEKCRDTFFADLLAFVDGAISK